MSLKKIDLKKIFSARFTATGDKTIQLKDFKNENLVLYFYPKDDTPGCTAEGKDFTRLYKKFRAQNCQILAVSKDSLASHEKFKAKYKYVFDLISDPDELLCNAFQVIKEKNLYGKKRKGIERSTFVIDTKGQLLKEWRKVKVEGHAEQVLAFVKTLKS